MAARFPESEKMEDISLGKGEFRSAGSIGRMISLANFPSGIE
jgi:hypothetical protein